MEDAASHRVELLRGGEDFFCRCFDLIRSAESEIILQTYIFSPDQTGLELITLLKDALRRGLDVWLLLDRFGSSGISPSLEELKTFKRFRFRYFGEWFGAEHKALGRRLHHKILVCDRLHYSIAGINVDTKYRGSADTEPWLDYGVFVSHRQQASALADYALKLHQGKANRYKPHIPNVLINDGLFNKKQIVQFYMRNIRKAESEIILVAAYFLPGIRLRKALRQAVKRGVRIRLVLAGLSDVGLAGRATRYLYPWLFRNGVEVYEWEVGILHAKLAVFDRRHATVGSFNLNHLSSVLSLEMNYATSDAEVVEMMHQEAERVLLQTIFKSPGQPQRFRYVSMFLNFCSYYLVKYLLRFGGKY